MKKVFNFQFMIFICLLGMFGLPKHVEAAVLYAGSAYDVVTEGQTFVVDWFLDTEGEEINTLQLHLKASPETLEILETVPGNSIFNLWLQPPQFFSQSGVIQLVSGVPNGVNGERIPVFRSVLRGKKPGTAQITMDPSSAALLNDGRGSQASLTYRVLTFLVSPKGTLPAQISSPTHPDENDWYQNNRVVIKTAPDEKETYSYSFSSNLEILPDEEPDELEDEMVFENLPDGIYYLKLNSKIGTAWQQIGIFRVQIDTTPPEEFSPRIDSDPSILGGKKFLSFATVDKTSGISHYKVKVGFGYFREAKAPYLVRRPLLGDKILIQAYDGAGNKRTVEIPYNPLLPRWSLAVMAVALIGLLLRVLVKRK